jgi:hypothetical protein
MVFVRRRNETSCHGENFLRQHAATTLACDFFTVETPGETDLRALLHLA